jgi:GntR family transcriptional repressor for pyruvate dehydrogenase complex
MLSGTTFVKELMATRTKKASRTKAAATADPTHGLPSKDDVTYWLVLRFRQLLSDGVLKPGARLPSERELATKFGVARSSLRQALKVLEVMGVITQRVGDGSYLNTDASSVLSVPMDFLFLLDDTSVQELVEMRLIVEPALAARAAERATSADIALMKQAIAEFESSAGDRVKLVSADLLFHRRIFQASGNRLSGRVFHMIHRAMLNMMMVTSRMVDLGHTLRFHTDILEAIEQREPRRAAKLMTEHLIDARELILHTHRETQAKQLDEYFSGASAMKSRRR